MIKLYDMEHRFVNFIAFFESKVKIKTKIPDPQNLTFTIFIDSVSIEGDRSE